MTILFLLFFSALVLYGTYRAVKLTGSTLQYAPNKAIPWYLAAFAVLLLPASFTTVDAGSVGIVKRWGQPTRSLMPGAHFIVPFADTVTSVPVQTRIVKPSEIAASKDLQLVNVEVTLAYHVEPEYATNILVELNNDAETRVIDPAILESIKAVTARYDVQQLVEQRAQVRDGIEEMVKQRLLPYHIIAETTSITDFSFSKEFESSIEAKVTAAQNAEQAKNKLEQVKIEAEQRVAKAEAEAKELRLQREQVTPELIQLRMIERWDGKLPEMLFGGGNGTVPMLDVLQARKGKAYSTPKE